MRSQELIDRALRLVPAIRERAGQADQLRHLPDSTVEELSGAELFKALVPRKWGGYQLDHHTVARMVAPISSVCGSTGWSLAVYCGHNWLAALLGDEAQREIYGDRGYALIPAPLNPGGATASKTSGGFRVSGRWPFATGVYHSDWAILPAMVEAKSDKASSRKEVEQIVFAVPREDFSVEDTWHVEGMRGTGSRDILIEDLLVPAHRVVNAVDVLGGKTVREEADAEGLYRLPAITSLLSVVEPVLTGIARGAIATYEETLRSRVRAFTAERQLNDAASHARLAEACVHVDAAELLIGRDLDEISQEIRQNALTTDQRVRVRLDSAFVASLCKHAVDLLVDSAGANALRDGSPLQRAFRDVHMLATHHFFEFDRPRELYGKVRLGLPIGTVPI